MKKELKKLSKEALAGVQGGTTLRQPVRGHRHTISGGLCGGDAMADSCVAIIHIPNS